MNPIDRSRLSLRPSVVIKALAALALAALGASASPSSKSAEDYLHAGAAKYIQSRLQEAGVEVEEGLRHYPDDARLKTLADQLKKMKDQQKKDQGGQSSQGGDQNQDKKDKQDSSGGDQNGKKDPQDQKKDQKDKDPAKDKEDGKDKDKNGAGQDGKDQPPPPEPGKEDSASQAAAPTKPGQMSKDEAERLLNSYQDDEKREQKQMQRRNRNPVEVEEDW